MDLLHAQFNHGRLSLEEIKTVLGSDFGQAWPTLQKKFAVDEAGKYFNEKAETIKNKRVAYSESRRKNKSGSNPTYDATYVPHMSLHMENENRNIDNKDKWNTKPGLESLGLELPEMKCGAVIQLFAISKQQYVTDKDIKALWEVFKQQNFNGEKYYAGPGDAFSHFINWSKGQTISKSSESRTDKYRNFKKAVGDE